MTSNIYVILITILITILALIFCICNKFSYSKPFYKSENNCQDIDNIIGNTPNLIPGLPKIVWILWFQGTDNLNYVEENVINSWYKFAKGWKIIILTEKNLSHYIKVDLKSTQTLQAQSDIIRLKLLSTHGGIWTDATVLCMGPLDWIEDMVKRTGFWMYHGRDNGRGPCSWFMISSKFSPLIIEWNKLSEEYWLRRKTTNDYFWMDTLFEQQRKKYPQSIISKEWKNVPFVNCESPGSSHYLAERVEKTLCDDVKSHIFKDNVPFVIKLARVIDKIYPKTVITNGHYVIKLTRTRDLIIAHCKEKLDWILKDRIYELFEKIYIYTKCDEKIDNVIQNLTNVIIIHLKNSGQESYTYLYHIVTNWDYLADQLVFITAQTDDPYRSYFYNYVVKNKYIDANIYGNAEYNNVFPMDFSLDDHMPRYNKDSKTPFVKSSFNNLYDFCNSMFGRENANIIKNSHQSCYNGILTVSKKTIKCRPINLYKRLLKANDIGALNEVVHFMERLYIALFELPLKYKLSILAILKNDHNELKEFINFYINQGVEHFYLIKTDSNYIDPKVLHESITVVYDDSKSCPSTIYNKLLTEIQKTCDWIMPIDINEYVYSKNDIKLIDVLDNYNDSEVGQIKIKMNVFNLNKQPVPNHENSLKFKSIIRTCYLREFGFYSSHVENCKEIISPFGENCQIKLNHFVKS